MSEDRKAAAKITKLKNIISHNQTLADEIKRFGFKVKHHENNIRTLNCRIKKLDDLIREKQVALGAYYESMVGEKELSASEIEQSEKQTLDSILSHKRSAAAILCSMKKQLPLSTEFLKHFIGVVATLGKVKDENLSSLLAEYLGLETMMAIVCVDYRSIKVFERYDENGMINCDGGLHSIGASMGANLKGRFLAISLENLRPYSGEFCPNDPQRRLDLLLPRMSNGELPLGFEGFAVNMIHVDPAHLSCITSDGKGLRETLFYSLFSHLQVYKTRSEMMNAIPCINDGAISLDGGIMKRSGFLSLGFREDIPVRFPIGDFSKLPVNIVESKEEVNLLRWKKERLSEDLQREEKLRKKAMRSFESKKRDSLTQCEEGLQNMIQDRTAGNQ